MKLLMFGLLFAGKASAAITTGLITFSDTGLFGEADTWSITPSRSISMTAWDFIAIDSDTFSLNNIFAADPIRAYEVPYLSRFGINDIPTTGLIASNLNEPVVNFDIPTGESIFIALDLSPDSPIESRNFAWIEIENNGGVLSSPNNAITTMAEPGLIIGTTTAIPEPSTTFLSFLLLPFLLRRSR